MAAPAVGARAAQDWTLDADTIKAGADLVGDTNPLHHDDAFAAASRYGELIASGAHTAAVLAGVASRGLGGGAGTTGAVGVEYNVQFRAAARVNRRFRLEWEVTETEPRRSGTLVRLSGRMIDTTDGVTVLAATMLVLHFAS